MFCFKCEKISYVNKYILLQVPAEVLDQLISNKRLYNIILQNYPSLLALRCNSEQKLPVEPIAETPKAKAVKMSMKFKLNKKEKKDFESKLDVVKEKLLQPIPENKPAMIVRQPERQDWFSRQFHTDHHYLRNVRLQRNSIMHRGAMMNIAKYKLRTSSCPNIYKNSMWSVEDQEEKVILRHRSFFTVDLKVVKVRYLYRLLGITPLD